MADSGDGRDAVAGARTGIRAAGRPRTPSTAALTSWLAFLVSTLVLVGLALLVRWVGPWVGEPRATAPSGDSPPITMSAPSQPQKLDVPHEAQAPGGPVPLTLKILLFAMIAVIVVLALVAFIRMVRRLLGDNGRLTRGGADSPTQLATPPPPERIAGDAGRDFDPRAAADAIVSCWLWVEEAADARGHPRRPSSTPTEFLDDFITAEGRDADGAARAHRAAQEFLPLYQRARFHHELLTADAAVVARAAAHTLIGGTGRKPAADTNSAATAEDGPS